MQALRYASRRALRSLALVQEPCMALSRTCSSEAGERAVTRLSKEQRLQLAKAFVEKFKAANSGKLPSISILRKEVGGKYDVLKEALQECEKHPSEQVATQESSEGAEPKESILAKTHKTSIAVKDGPKRKSPVLEDELGLEGAVATRDQHDAEELTEKGSKGLKGRRKKQFLSKKGEDSKKDEMLTTKRSKSLEDVKPVPEADAKSTSKSPNKQKQSGVQTEVTLKPPLEGLVTDEDDDDDSDVAAPEYQAPSPQVKEDFQKAKDVVLKLTLGKRTEDGRKRHNEDQATHLKQVNQDAKQQWPNGSSGLWSKQLSQYPASTVLRVVNLPLHVSKNQFKSACESVAEVQAVNMRRRRIADIQFNVDPRDMPGVLDRMRTVSIGSSILKVFPAHRFSCDGDSKPANIQHLRSMRNLLIHSFDQRFQTLCFQFEDYRKLHDLKVQSK